MRIKLRFFKNFLIVAPLQVLFIPAVFAEQETITIYAVNYPPYSIETPKQDGLRGFDAEVVIEAYDRVGIPATIEFMPWARIMMRAEQGKIAAALSCAKAKKREHFISYSPPISSATHSFVAKKTYDGETPRNLRDAHDKKITVVDGYTTKLELKSAGIPYQAVINDEAGLNVLLKRDFDFFYSTREFVQYITSGKIIASQIKYFDVKETSYHLCFSQGWPSSKFLLTKFNKGLTAIKADGTYDKIHAKYQ
ncbi:substrate-binding periplasmic protein [Kiloniella sp.]|uniref:substrate-binding periplasmic protein n=1 Tax=Kiloniella sp. TaxID=1938587 RepID=UPI003A8CD6CF